MPEKQDDTIITLLSNPVSRDRGFTLMMDTYKERIYWHIRRLVITHEDAEDILQEAFINAYRYAGSFNGQSKMYTWLYRIATNECIRWMKKRKTFRPDKPGPLLMKSENDGYVPVDETEIIRKFQQAILQLPEKQRLVFNLRYYDDLNYEEIAQILNSSVNALKTNYHYATEKIKDFMINN